MNIANSNTLLDTLKTQPSTLAMILISFGLLAYVFYQGYAYNKQRIQMTDLILQHQRESNAILANCLKPPPQPPALPPQ